MNLSTFASAVSALAVAVLALTGCGVTLDARKVSPEEIGPVIGGEGAIYSLPQTQIELAQSAVITSVSGGALADIWDGCSRQCKEDGGKDGKLEDKANACVFKNLSASLRLLAPEIRTSNIPDPTHMYRVDPKADAFQTLNVQLELGNTGILKSATSTGSNSGYEILTSLAKLVLDIKPLALSKVRGKHALAQSKGCVAAQRQVAELVSSEPQGKKLLTCQLQSRIDSCLAPYSKVVEDWQSQRVQLHKTAISRQARADLVALSDAFMKEKLADAKVNLDDAMSRYELAPAAKTQGTFELVTMIGTPGEFMPLSVNVDLTTSLKSGATKVTDGSADSTKLRGDLLSLIEQAKVGYAFNLAVPLAVGVNASQEPTTGGYRYRVPVLSPVSVSVFANNGKGVQSSAMPPLISVVPIAQHGPIAMLPSRFVGKGGKVAIKLSDVGGLQTVEIGADAIPTAAVTDVLGKVGDQVKDKRKADADAAKIDPELAGLTREKDLLDLKVKIQQLQKDLNTASQ